MTCLGIYSELYVSQGCILSHVPEQLVVVVVAVVVVVVVVVVAAAVVVSVSAQAWFPSFGPS